MPAVLELQIPSRPDFEELQERMRAADMRVEDVSSEALLFDALAAVFPHIKAEHDGRDHRGDCRRGDFDPCDCRRVPGVAERLESERQNWSELLELVTTTMRRAVDKAARIESDLNQREWWERKGESGGWDPYDVL